LFLNFTRLGKSIFPDGIYSRWRAFIETIIRHKLDVREGVYFLLSRAYFCLGFVALKINHLQGHEA